MTHQCEECNKTFASSYALFGHLKAHTIIKPPSNRGAIISRERREAREIAYNQNPNTCQECNSVFTYKDRKKKFCNSSCFAIKNNQIRDPKCYKKQSESLKKRNALEENKQNRRPRFTRIKIATCLICQKQFYIRGRSKIRQACSKECRQTIFRAAGKKAASVLKKRSVNEINLFNLCQSYFNRVSHNTILVDGWDADIVIYDLDLAVCWNGPWHYREMTGLKHSLKQVQNRDRIKTNILRKNGWVVLTFEDRHWSPKEAFDEIKTILL